jgi:ribosomal protein S18 acetylase RimI-like enzyme
MLLPTNYWGAGLNRMENKLSVALHSDAVTLRDAMRQAVSTSPGSFLRTVADVNAETPEYWASEIRSSKWAVAQQGGKVVGIAAGKHPNPNIDMEDPATSRYIESVWVAPGLRRRRLGERLIKYLLTAEYLDNHHIRQFLLWVYATNDPAMRLYEHIGFVPTREMNVGTRTEIKYRLDFNPELHTTIRLLGHGTHRHDLLYRDVTYRVLGQSER